MSLSCCLSKHCTLNIPVVKYDVDSAMTAGSLDDERLTVMGLLAETWAALSARGAAAAGRPRPRAGRVRGLLRLARSPEGLLRMTDLAAQTTLTSSGITRVVDRLVERGLVTRRACATDRRTTYAVITDSGRQLLAEVLPGQLALIEDWLVEPLRAAGRLAELVAALRTLRDHADPCAVAGAEPSAEPEAVGAGSRALCRRLAELCGPVAACRARDRAPAARRCADQRRRLRRQLPRVSGPGVRRAGAPGARRCRRPGPRRRPASRTRPARRPPRRPRPGRRRRSGREPKLACRSAPESNSSRESLACTRSTRPVTALTRSTTPASSSPPACAWQVSRQKPTVEHRRLEPVLERPPRAGPSRSRRRAIALSPPAVFSMRTGSGGSQRSNVLAQLSKPPSGSSSFRTCPPCTIRPLAPDLGGRAPRAVASSLRLGMRIRLLAVATLSRYGACT